MSDTRYVPPSLRTVPNRQLSSLSDEELLEEYAYYDNEIKNATGWGAYLGECDKQRRNCKREMERRGM